MKQSSERIEFLDHVRGLAILAVFLFHSLQDAYNFSSLPWAGWFPSLTVPKSFLWLLPVSFGWAGVAIFFVVSGFCIHLSFQKGNRDWRDFFCRRFFRIYPAYLLAVLGFALFFPYTRLIFYHRPGDAWLQLESHVLLFHNLVSHATYYGINGSFWSIAVEVQLYLLYPLLMLLVARLGWRRTMFGLLICELSLRAMSSLFALITNTEIPFWAGGAPFAFWFSWALGAAVAEAWLRGHTFSLAQSRPLVWLALALACNFIKPLSPFTFLVFAVLTAIVISKLLDGQTVPVFSTIFNWRYLRLAGIWSYSIYLLHQPLIGALSGIISRHVPGMAACPATRFFLYAASGLVIVPLCGLWYQLIEAPGIAFGKRFLRKA